MSIETDNKAHQARIQKRRTLSHNIHSAINYSNIFSKESHYLGEMVGGDGDPNFFINSFGDELMYIEDGYCASTSMMALFGPEIISASDRMRYVSEQYMIDKLHEITQINNIDLIMPTSSSSFISLMEDPSVIGALVFQPGEETGHVLAIIPQGYGYHSVDLMNGGSIGLCDDIELADLYASARLLEDYDEKNEIWIKRGIRFVLVLSEVNSEDQKLPS